MKYKFKLFSDENKCILANEVDCKLNYDDLKKKSDVIVIDIEKHEAEKLFDFFKTVTLKAILSGDNQFLEIDEDDVKNESFYNEDFIDLIELIKENVQKCNELINYCYEKNSNS